MVRNIVQWCFWAMEKASSCEMRNFVFLGCFTCTLRIILRHATIEVFVETRGPVFRGLLRSGNYSILTRRVIDYLLVRES